MIAFISTALLTNISFAAPTQPISGTEEEDTIPSVHIPTTSSEVTSISPSGVVTVTPTTPPPSQAQATVTVAPSVDAPTEDAKEREAIHIDQDFKIIPAMQHEANKQLSYIIDVEFPQISGKTLTAHAKEFNRLMGNMVKESMQQFKNYVKADVPHMQTLPESIRHNKLHIDYDIDLIKPVNHTFISVRLSIEGMQAGRAHPYHTYKVLNFDLNQGKVLTLNDIFKPGKNYLKAFAKYSNATLSKKLQDKWMIAKGTAPIPKNYQFWNIQSDGILITFNEYQVAPYANGAQEVEIPYPILQPLILSEAPVASCIKNSGSCEA